MDLSDEDDMQVPHKLRFPGRKKFTDLLQNVIGQEIFYILIYSKNSYLRFQQLNYSSGTRKVTKQNFLT